MSTVLVNALPGTLPVGFCPTGATALQDLYNEFILRTQFSLSADKAFYNFGPTAPTPENRQFPWLQTSNGYPVRWWVFFGGFWVWPHAVPASSHMENIWRGDTTALITFDGGEAGPITATTGAMWEVDTDFDGRSPMGVGAIPTSNPAKTLALDENFGEGAHSLVKDELPLLTDILKVGVRVSAAGHDSSPPGYDGGSGGQGNLGNTNDSSIYPGSTADDNGFPQAKLTTTQTVPQTNITHNTVHPVRGCYIIKRTARIYYRQ